MPIAVESLESRRHFIATTRVDPAFGLVQTDTGSLRDVATKVAALPNGNVLISGLSIGNDSSYPLRNVFVMYTADGRPDPTFGKNGVVTQSAQSFDKTQSVSSLTAMNDGSVLVEQQDGVHRLKADGTFDKAFGQGGRLAGQVGQSNARTFVNADGTLAAFDYGPSLPNGTPRFRVNFYNSRGRKTGFSGIANGAASRLPDGRIVAITRDNRVSLYDAGLKPVKSFGKNGLIELNATLRKWTAGQGKWYSRGTLLNKADCVVSSLTPAADGGWIADAVVYGSHRTDMDTVPRTNVPVRLNAAGKVIAINDGAGRTGVTFTATGSNIFGGTFKFGTGGPVRLPSLVSGDVYATARAADGSFYVAGQIGNHIAITRTMPVAGRITGVAFGDTNRDGVRQPKESVFSGKRIYIDANNNGRLDAGEARTTTDAAGRYSFDDLGPGNFVVRRELPVGYRSTTYVKPLTLVAGNQYELDLGSIAVR